jgi:hypothetical protein
MAIKHLRAHCAYHATSTIITNIFVASDLVNDFSIIMVLRDCISATPTAVARYISIANKQRMNGTNVTELGGGASAPLTQPNMYASRRLSKNSTNLGLEIDLWLL